MPFSILVSILLSLPFGGSTSQFQFAEDFSFSSGFVPVLLLLLMAASFEELGWRGYAFDSLQSRYTYFTASIVFSILWSLWHFPLIFVNNSYQYEIFHENIWYGVNFFISIIPMGVIISWICIKNGKSVLAAILFHFIINMSQEVLAITQFTKCIETVVLAVVAAVIIASDKEMFFSTEHLAAEVS
jgi:membrane protease YdiL (CAAX protease family)